MKNMNRLFKYIVSHLDSNRFSGRLLKSFLKIAIIPVVITSVVSYILCYSTILSNSISVSHEISDYAAEEIDRLQQSTENIAISLLRSSEMQIVMRYKDRQNSSTNLISAYHINSSLKTIKDASPTNISGIYMIGNNGMCYQSNTTSENTKESVNYYGNQEWYKTAINSETPIWFSPHENSYIKEYEGVNIIDYAVPYIDYITEKPVGVILIELDANAFFATISNKDAFGANTYYVVDNDDQIIYKSDSSDATTIEELNAMEGSSHCYTNRLCNGWKIIGVISRGVIVAKAITQLSVELIVMLLICLTLAVRFSVRQSKNISSPISSLIDNMKIVQTGNYDVEIALPENAKEVYSDEMIALYNNFNKMIDKSNQYMDQIRVEQENLRSANLKALQAQINPHFLYNTMDTIAWNIRLNENEKAINTLVTLTKFFRSSLRKGADVVTLEQEMEQVTLYFQIQMARYDDMLSYSVDYDEALKSYQVPKLTIQPIVENAIYHGIKDKEEYGHISVRTHIYDDYYTIEVVDDGMGMTKEQVEDLNNRLERGLTGESESGGYGIYNVNERIKIYFGKQYGLRYFSKENEYTRVEIQLPILKQEEDHD